MSTISVGDRLPDFTFLTLDHETGQPKPLTTKEITEGRKISEYCRQACLWLNNCCF